MYKLTKIFFRSSDFFFNVGLFECWKRNTVFRVIILQNYFEYRHVDPIGRKFLQTVWNWVTNSYVWLWICRPLDVYVKCMLFCFYHCKYNHLVDYLLYHLITCKHGSAQINQHKPSWQAEIDRVTFELSQGQNLKDHHKRIKIGMLDQKSHPIWQIISKWTNPSLFKKMGTSQFENTVPKQILT